MSQQNDFENFLAHRAVFFIDQLANRTGVGLDTCARALPDLLGATVAAPVYRWSRTKIICDTYHLPRIPVLAFQRELARAFTVFVHDTNLPVVVGHVAA